MLSIVVCTRNDNYGGNGLHRFQVFLDTWQTYWQIHSLDIELVVVEWNPLLGEKRLYEVVTWMRGFPIRFIEVSPEIHDAIQGSDKVPVWEYRGKNVGVRRAKGDWILCTNPDLIYSEATILFIISLLADDSAEARNCYYRVTRAELEADAIPPMSLSRTLLFCAQNSVVEYPYKAVDALFTNASGDFTLMHRDKWAELEGYQEVAAVRSLDGLLLYKAQSIGVREVVHPSLIYHIKHVRGDVRTWPRYDYYVAHLDELEKQPEWGLAQVDLPEYPKPSP